MLTEVSNDAGGSNWEIGCTANMEKDGRETQEGRWDAGRVGLILLNHGIEMMSKHYKDAKLAEAHRALAEQASEQRIVLPPGSPDPR